MTQDSTLKISCHQCMQKLDVSSLEPFSYISCPVCNADLIVPQWFDSYLLKEPGESGGMATVYRAHDPALEREIAIKVLSPEYSNDPLRSHQFLQEARTAATVNHHAIVAIYTCGVYKGQCYIVMQYMPGGTLEDQLRKANGKLPVETVTEWIRDVAEGLECAQKYGIVHHDIKPGNILLDGEGNAKIGDFGLAQMIRTQETPVEGQSTFSRFWISPNYVSPEKVRTNEEDYRGDIYSLGATFYHLLTGSTPFTHSDMDELIRMRLTESPMPPHFHRAEINTELSQLIISMLAKNPDDRPSYRTIIKVLNRILKNHSASTVPLHVRELRKNKIQPAYSEKTDSLPASTPAPKRMKVLLSVFLLFLLIFAGTILALRLTAAPPPIKQEMQVLPFISADFSVGNVVGAEKSAKEAARNPALTEEQRLLAAYQYACALYLQKKPDSGKKIKQLLAQMNLNYPEKKWKSLYIPLKQMCEPGKKLRLTEREGASIPLMTLADFLIFACSNRNHKEIFHAFRILQEQLATLPERHWIRLCWEQRFPLWQNILEYGLAADSTVEPLFHIKSLNGKKSMGLNNTAKERKTLFSSETDTENDADIPIPDVSAAALKEAAERYNRQNRPMPGAPCVLSLQNTQEYLEALPAEKQDAERKRLIFMCNLIPYIVPASGNNPFQTEHFATLDGKEYRDGQLLFSANFVSFKNEGGLQRIEWNQIPSGEIQKILKYYISLQEKRDKTAVKKVFQQELATAYIRYALFCQWYGHYEEAEKYAIRTLKYLPGNKTNKLLIQLLLK
ncbi:MAG: serine/threonine protein kinase [Lentisphaeria bacterium]|nr:serine/threonine protein kinase [Lentisphaeria bacterium]